MVILQEKLNNYNLNKKWMKIDIDIIVKSLKNKVFSKKYKLGLKKSFVIDDKNKSS